MNVVLYIHGKGASAKESGHYKPLFPDCKVIGLDYQTFTPWDTGAEIHDAVVELKSKYDNVILIANSIGAFFSMNAGIDKLIQKAYFISPVVDMERLNGYELTGEWLCFVNSHPVEWNVPTQILYGSNDHLISLETVIDFAKIHQATLTIMDGGEHWFHTKEQMQFLDKWIQQQSNLMDYRKEAKDCVKDHVLPLHKHIYAKFDGDFDRIYSEGYDSKSYQGRVIEPGKVYELSYLECSCPKVKCGLRSNPEQCECSRQSILYILSQLEPESQFDVQIENTILRGGDRCTFRITRCAGVK